MGIGSLPKRPYRRTGIFRYYKAQSVWHGRCDPTGSQWRPPAPTGRKHVHHPCLVALCRPLGACRPPAVLAAGGMRQRALHSGTAVGTWEPPQQSSSVPRASTAIHGQQGGRLSNHFAGKRDNFSRRIDICQVQLWRAPMGAPERKRVQLAQPITAECNLTSEIGA
jgi:hypothetical protein